MQQRNFPILGRAARAPRLPFARATAWNNQRGTSVTVTANMRWTAPPGARLISLIRGRGSDGLPDRGAHNLEYGFDSYSQEVNFDTHGNGTTEPEQYQGFTVGVSPPKDYCEEIRFLPDGSATTTCHRFVGGYIDTGDFQPAAPGVAATAFGRTFPGGASAQQASETTAFNIEITPGTAYQLIVPAGGRITFEYS